MKFSSLSEKSEKIYRVRKLDGGINNSELPNNIADNELTKAEMKRNRYLKKFRMLLPMFRYLRAAKISVWRMKRLMTAIRIIFIICTYWVPTVQSRLPV